jgi:predicted RNA binding protein YcfA (HicA-like mRNA interferase family)
MTDSIPAIKPEALMRALARAGFYVHHQTGSHVAMRHRENKTKRVTIPRHRKTLKKGTLASILKQAGLTIEEFKRLL